MMLTPPEIFRPQKFPGPGPVQFGRKPDAQESGQLREIMADRFDADQARRVQDGLALVVDQNLENFEQWGFLQKGAFLKEMMGDFRRIVGALKAQGLPDEDQPLLLVFRGPDGLDPSEFKPDEALKRFGHLLPGEKLEASAQQSYSREDARRAASDLISTKSPAPVKELVHLLEILFERSEAADMVKLPGGRYAYRLIIPGKN